MKSPPLRTSRINHLVEKIFAVLFFFFFSYQIFSPQFGGRTIYLEYFFILFNPYFWSWAYKVKLPKSRLYLMWPVVVLLAFHPVAAIKLLIILVGVSYLYYCYDRKLFYLHAFVLISVLVALVQFLFLMAGKSSLAFLIGPTHLATLVWGAHATETFTNFYTLFLLPRVSGLSREAGFFVSFLISGFLAVVVNNAIARETSGKKAYLPYVSGLIVSLSKASLAVIPAMLLIRFRRLIDRLPVVFTAIGFVVVLIVFWDKYEPFLLISGNGTFFGRFAGYALLDDLDLKQLLLGVPDLSQLHTPLANLAVSRGYSSLYGLGGWFIQNGLIAFLFYIFSLRVFGIRSSGLLLILLITATVGIDTNQNFCVLSYYVAFMLPRLKGLKLA